MCCVCMLIMCYIGILQKYSVNIKRNNLYDTYLAHQGKRNIHEEAKEFRKQEG